MPAAFPQKLRLVLKLLSMSGAQLAQHLGVDKSVTSRWLSGAVRPSAHNMARLSALLATQAPAFRMIDWDRDEASLAEIFGGEAAQGTGAERAAEGLTLAVWDEAVQTSAQRAGAYEGFYRIVRPMDQPPGVFAYEYSYIRSDPCGLMRMTLASFGALAEGWLLPLHNQLYVILADDISGGLTFAILNGLASTKVDAVDGVSIAMSHDVGRTPTALPVYCERIGDLSGDPAADQGRFAELARECRQPAEGEISAALKAHLLPDTGPKAREAGGEWLMQIRLAHSMSRTAGLKEQIAAGQARPHGAAAEAEDEDGGEGFAAKLRLVLKLLTLSSAQLASALEIHKSVVSRWLSGGVEPSAHNLGRLTALIASRAPGFSALDWERSLEGLAQMFGADPASYPAPRRKAAKVMPLIIWDQMLATAERRGSAYEGFFRTTRPSLSEIGGFIHEYGIIQPHPSGLPRFRLASFGSFLDGWMIPLHDQLYCITADVTNGVLMFGVFNGVGAARVDVVDGLVLSPSPDAGRSPTAVPLISEHVEDLTGDPEADEARFAELSALKRFVDVDAVPQALRDRLLRDVGPKAFAEGGALVLQMPLAGSLARARGVKAAG